MGRFRSSKIAVGLVLTSALLLAQGGAVFTSKTTLRRLLITVKNSQGQLVGNLERPDFKVSVSGIVQEIAAFEHHTEQPLSIALLLDASGSTRKDLEYEIQASRSFLASITKDGNQRDALCLFTFDQDVTPHGGFTRGTGRIDAALKNVRASAGTSVYDALYLAAETLEKRDGRHVIVIVSDGVDTTSAYKYHDALKMVHAADVVVYSVVVIPVRNDPGRNIGGENALIGISQSTGGKAFSPASREQLTPIFSQILKDLRTQYLIDFYPRNLPESKEPFRPVRVELATPGLQASTRGGYYED